MEPECQTLLGSIAVRRSRVDELLTPACAPRRGRVLSRADAPFRGEPAGRVDDVQNKGSLSVATLTTILPGP